MTSRSFLQLLNSSGVPAKSPSPASNWWEWEINSKTTFWGGGVQEVWSYRHLVLGLIRRYFLLYYQQTLLGPLWMLLQPTITLLTYLLVFNKVIGISTGSIPPVLFYAASIILWNYFSDSVISTSKTFKENAQLYSKVYFPRIIPPLAEVNVYFLRFLIQLGLLAAILGYFLIWRQLSLPLTLWVFVGVLLCAFVLGCISLGLGLVFSVLTAKYRDLSNLIGVGVRLLMFLTPVVYPLEVVPEAWRWVVNLNPLTHMFELFRFSLFGYGSAEPFHILYSTLVAVVLAGCGMLIFNKQATKLIDVV